MVKSVGSAIRIMSSWISFFISCTPHLDGVCHGSELSDLNRFSNREAAGSAAEVAVPWLFFAL